MTSLVRHFDQQHRGEAAAHSIQGLAEGVGLPLVAREAVQQEAVAGVLGLHAGPDHPDDDLVGDEFAGAHVLLGLAAQLAPGGDLGAEHVAGRDVGELEVQSEPLGLSPFACAGRAEQYQVQLGHSARESGPGLT